MDNIDWIKKGNTGCTFATLFSKNPKAVGWYFITPEEWVSESYSRKSLLLSIEFPYNYTLQDVKEWALKNDFYLEDTSDNTEGLRLKCDEGISWVQYFGPDSHVKTRQSPKPMLLFTRKLNKLYYYKVGFKGILHLAHAWMDGLDLKKLELLWNRSFIQTKSKLGQSPDITQAAKTTYLK